jgi:ribosomal protein L9
MWIFLQWPVHGYVYDALQIILKKNIPGLGESGAIVRVPNGFYRNFLKPKGLALPVTEGILRCG